MLADNDTPLASLALEQLRPDGRRMAVVVVRCRIELDEDGQPDYAEPQELVLSDCCSGDPQKDPLTFASDLVPSRHAADVTFRGSAHAAVRL